MFLWKKRRSRSRGGLVLPFSWGVFLVVQIFPAPRSRAAHDFSIICLAKDMQVEVLFQHQGAKRVGVDSTLHLPDPGVEAS